MEKSNITITSNIYPINRKAGRDLDFLNHIEGRRALDALHKKGLYCKNGFTKSQKEQHEYGMKCHGNEDGDITWGHVKVDGEFRMKCRCTMTSCEKFQSCRPDFSKDELKYVISKSNIIVDNKPNGRKETSITINGPKILLTDGEVKDVTIIDEKIEKKIKESEPQKDEKLSIVDEIWQSMNKEQTEDNEYVEGNQHVELERNVVEQKYVIEASEELKILVNAGPGTGKTYTLIERLKYLTDECGINTAEDMMVLCFSRAAVAEIRNRIKKAINEDEVSDDLRFLDIRTFDSFATYLLNEIGNDIDLSKLDYDARIKMACKLIQTNTDIFSNFKHFIVDEIQDLVGDRAQLVKEILKSLNCGFTLLGDSCQAIYDYQVKKSKGIDSREFYEWVDEYFGDNIQKLEYLGNYRQTNELNEVVSKVREAILKNVSDENKKKVIRNSLKNVTRIDDIAIMARVLSEFNGTSCFLCRNNGEVQKIAQYLRNLGIVHSIQKAANNKSLEPWIGKLLGRYEYESLDFSDFKEEMLKCGKFEDFDIENKWNTISNLAQTSSSRIVIKDFISNLVMESTSSNDLYINDKCNIVVSTIHRAKGREYDGVVLLEDAIISMLDREYDGDGLNDELKTFYVSITRPRKKLLMTKFKRKSYLHQVNKEGRWVETSKKLGKKYKILAFLEVGKENDVDDYGFISMNVFGDEKSILDNQKYIAGKVNKGDELILKSFEGGYGQRYRIIHNGNTIGVMSNSFSVHLERAINRVQGFVFGLPSEIHNVYVEEVISCVSRDVSADMPEPYKRTKLWNGVSIVGFGSVKWKISDI